MGYESSLFRGGRAMFYGVLDFSFSFFLVLVVVGISSRVGRSGCIEFF